MFVKRIAVNLKIELGWKCQLACGELTEAERIHSIFFLAIRELHFDSFGNCERKNERTNEPTNYLISFAATEKEVQFINFRLTCVR